MLSKIISPELKQAIETVRAGDVDKGRDLLKALLEKDPRNELAWLWLAQAVSSQKQQKFCLETVLTINPKNSYARQQLAALKPATSSAQAEKIVQPLKSEDTTTEICCAKCNTLNAADSKFCRECGFSLTISLPDKINCPTCNQIIF